MRCGGSRSLQAPEHAHKNEARPSGPERGTRASKSAMRSARSLGAPTPVTVVTDASWFSGDTPLVNMVRRPGTNVLLEPGDTEWGWNGEAASASLIQGSPVAARYDLQRRLLVPNLPCVLTQAPPRRRVPSGAIFFARRLCAQFPKSQTFVINETAPFLFTAGGPLSAAAAGKRLRLRHFPCKPVHARSFENLQPNQSRTQAPENSAALAASLADKAS
jgi:hypothetical protein